jgi:membrane associated rhomboid family serine protease
MNPSGAPFSGLPTVVKNLLIINGLFFLFTLLHPLGLSRFELGNLLDMHYFRSPLFKPWQLITYMFMHSDQSSGNGWYLHIVMNMFGLYMFGPRLEYHWGSKRFLNYYMLCGVGAAVIYMGWLWFGASDALAGITAQNFAMVKKTVIEGAEQGVDYTISDPASQGVYDLFRTSMRGASGAIFGLLLAFGMVFPNVELMMLFVPFPIKAKWFVVGYAALELYRGLERAPGDNTAHFAHLGGMVVGLVLVLIWERNNTFFENPWR